MNNKATFIKIKFCNAIKHNYMTTRNLIFFFILLLTSCSTNTDKNTTKQTPLINDTIVNKHLTKDTVNDNDESGISEPQFVTDSSKMQILYLTDTLYKGDTLKINFKVPHFKDLAISTPKDKFYFVVYAQPEKDKPSLVDWNDFAYLKTIQIITDKTKANPWDASYNTNQIIFKETGTYQIKLSENLETDDGTPIEVKNVYYIDKPRKE